MTPRQLLVRQLQAEDSYELVDLVQEYLDSRHDLRTSSKRQVLRVLRSFFKKNRCSLPADAEFTIRSEVAPTDSKQNNAIDVRLPAHSILGTLILRVSMWDKPNIPALSMNCPKCHPPELLELGRSLRSRRGETEVILDYLCPRCQRRWERTSETGIKII